MIKQEKWVYNEQKYGEKYGLSPAIITYLKAGFVINEWKENWFGNGQSRLLFRLP